MIELVENALKSLWKKDSELIRRNVHEECINYRLAVYLEEEFKNIMYLNSLSIDIEYNKNGAEPKIYGDNDKKFRPDIIIHERSSNQNNYIVIEAKKCRLSKKDKEKLISCKNEPYNYRLALGIEYGVDKNYFTIYAYSKDGTREKINLIKTLD